jgi:hypothetical protein
VYCFAPFVLSALCAYAALVVLSRLLCLPCLLCLPLDANIATARNDHVNELGWPSVRGGFLYGFGQVLQLNNELFMVPEAMFR